MRPPVRRILGRARRQAGRARRLAGRVRRRVAERKNPLVSVVVTARASHVPFLEECLGSVGDQTGIRLQILVAPYGRDAKAVSAKVRPAVEAQRRLSLVDQPGVVTLGAARNAGAAHASGDYLVFVNGADVIPPGAFERLVHTLEATGSDFARGVINVDRPQPGELAPGHRLQPARRTSLEETPLAVNEFFVEGIVFRRGFWTRHGLSYADTDGPELVVTDVRMHLAARTFDVIAGPGYRWMDRGSGRVVGLEQDELEELASWAKAQDAIRSLLEGTGEAIRHAWLTGVIGTSLKALLENAERATPEQWAQLRETVQGMIDLGGPGLLAEVAVLPRLYAWLTSEDRREDLEELVAERRFERNNFETLVEDGEVYARLPLFRDSTHPVPDELCALSHWETPLATSLRAIRWPSEDQLELVLFAFIRYVSMEHEQPEVAVRLVGPEPGQHIDLPVRQHVDLEVTRYAAMRWQCYDRGALSVFVDATDLVARSAADRQVEWRLEVELTASGVTRRSRVSHRLLTGAAGPPNPRQVAGRIVDVPGGAGSVAVAVAPVEASVADVRIEHRAVTGVISCPSGTPTQLVATRGRHRVAVPLGDADGAFRLELPKKSYQPTDLRDRTWDLHVVTAEGDHPLAWPAAEHAWAEHGSASELALRRTGRGHVSVAEVAGLASLDEVVLEEESLVLRGSWLGLPPPGWTLALQGPRIRMAAEVHSHDDHGHFEVRAPLVIDEWGAGATFLPVGTYRIVLGQESGQGPGPDLPLMIGPQLEDALPQDQMSNAFRARVGRGAAGRPFIRLQKPYADDELGAYAQQVLRSAYQDSTAPIDENAVYLQSYTGNTATDSPLALHHELRRTHPHLTLYWGVADSATVLPEGAVPVHTYTREYYEVLARAKYLVNNIDFARWFARKPGQRHLQTFHGYPSKSMGIRMWQAKNFTPRRIAAELERTSGDWDLILTPAPEMDQYYRTEYAYDGAILSHGYPRDDILVGDRGAAVRDRTRELLGIKPHQTAVLYAPTWRDDLATTYQSSPLVRHLDLEKSSEALGDDFVLLMRGHRFHVKEERSAKNARLVDVTDYPEINDLILASDVAVLDYSSLRFDFALTNRPMLFLVPDLETYAGGARGFLFPFEDSAPGPLIEHADEVVAMLRDLDRVRAEHRETYERFNETYNYLQDGHSAEHVVAAFFDEPGGEPDPEPRGSA